jgi:ribosomal protein L15
MANLVKSGKAKETKDGYEMDLSEYKVLGKLNEKVKLIIKAKFASRTAIESVKQHGGEIKVQFGSDDKEE